VSLTIFLGVLTLAPALLALAVVTLGITRRALPGVVLGLACAGVLIPAICLLLLAPDLSTGVPIDLGLFGGIAGDTARFSAGYRLDPFALYAAFGLAFIVTPLLVWMAWQSAVPAPSPAQPAADANASTSPTVDVDEDESAAIDSDVALAALERPRRRILAPTIWGGIALALWTETAALTLIFSDNLLWLGLSWLALALLVWALGEVGSDLATLDRAGLAIMLAAPVLWVVAMLLGAIPAKSLSLANLMGRGTYSPPQIVFLGIVLAFAGGAYPFTVWVRRRASLVTPAGLAAVALVSLPVTLFVGARSYMAAQDNFSLWPQIGRATPPITAGIAFALLGALTVAINGLLALRVRDARAIIGLLAAAQIGWGLVALGIAGPLGAAATVVLLATAILGLGALLASIYAAGVVTSDLEPEATGPRPLGTPFRPLALATWSIGALTLIGAPLFAGFISRQIVAAASLRAGGLIIPLTGLTWAGDALLGIALLRMTAPAFAASLIPSNSVAAGTFDAAVEDEPFTGTDAEEMEEVEVEEEEGEEEEVEVEEEEDGNEAVESLPSLNVRRPAVSPQVLRELPGAVLALLALVIAVVPQLLFSLGGSLAAGGLVQAGSLDSTLTLKTLGYEAGASQWLPGLAWLSALAFVVLLVVLLPGGSRVVKPIQYAAVPAPAEGQPASELAGLAEPEDVWSDLRPAFTSEWTQPGATWLLTGLEGEAGDTGEGDEAGEDEASEDDASEDEASAEEDAGEADEVEPDAVEVDAVEVDAVEVDAVAAHDFEEESLETVEETTSSAEETAATAVEAAIADEPAADDAEPAPVEATEPAPVEATEPAPVEATEPAPVDASAAENGASAAEASDETPSPARSARSTRRRGSGRQTGRR
jgi:hypothetical protein